MNKLFSSLNVINCFIIHYSNIDSHTSTSVIENSLISNPNIFSQIRLVSIFFLSEFMGAQTTSVYLEDVYAGRDTVAGKIN